MKKIIPLFLIFSMILSMAPLSVGYAAGAVPEAGSLMNESGYFSSYRDLFDGMEQLLTSPESPLRYRGGAKLEFQYPASSDPQIEECNFMIGSNYFSISAIYEHDARTDDYFELLLVVAAPDGSGGIDIMNHVFSTALYFSTAEAKDFTAAKSIVSELYNEARWETTEGKELESVETVMIGTKMPFGMSYGFYILSKGKSEDTEVEKTPSSIPSSVKVGDVISFGTYEQDNNRSDGQEPIEWQVLDVKDGKALLISKYALDYRPYNDRWTAVTWDTCELRRWLNNVFLNAAFGAEDQKRIVLSTVTADKNSSSRSNPGKDTQDKIFCLSIKEAASCFRSDVDRLCLPTDYTLAKGCMTNIYSGACTWLLRSPGYDATYVVQVTSTGKIDDEGGLVKTEYCVRPALWLDLRG